MVRDEDDIRVPVPAADELVEQEKEAPGEILLHRAHRAGGIHDADDDGIRLRLDVGNAAPIAQIVLMKGETVLARGVGQRRGSRRRAPTEAGAGGALLVEMRDRKSTRLNSSH